MTNCYLLCRSYGSTWNVKALSIFIQSFSCSCSCFHVLDDRNKINQWLIIAMKMGRFCRYLEGKVSSILWMRWSTGKPAVNVRGRWGRAKENKGKGRRKGRREREDAIFRASNVKPRQHSGKQAEGEGEEESDGKRGRERKKTKTRGTLNIERREEEERGGEKKREENTQDVFWSKRPQTAD